MQVTIVGGGSYQWSPRLMADLLSTPCLAGARIVLMDTDPAPLPKMEALFLELREAVGGAGGATVATTTDRRRALDGADFVVVTISTGGFASMAVDLDVPAAFGIRQSVGDTVGPGGINRALRNVPVLVDIARDMEQHCADAWMLNLTNPMTCLTRGVARDTAVKVVGLCHEVGHYCLDAALALGVPADSVRPTVTGVNHFPVVTALDVAGADGLARLAHMVEELGGLDHVAAGLEGRKVAPLSTGDFARRHRLSLTLLDRYGALPAAGDRHLAEFLPSVLTQRSGWGARWGIAPTPISVREEMQAAYVAGVDAVLAGTQEPDTSPSGELVAPVIDSLVTGRSRELPLNIPNAGQCPDLPDEVVVESMCVVDGGGIRGRDRARAPAPLAELLRRHVAVQELTVEAALGGDRSLVHAAMALDPLAGRGDLHEIEAMAEALVDGTAQWLPRFSSLPGAGGGRRPAPPGPRPGPG